jgi:hypothetical protein
MADIAKVKRNIQKMIDQGAPETDIDAYVASEGTSPEELQGALKPQVGYVEDMAKGAAAGVAQGAIGLPGAFGDTAQINSNLMSGGAEMLGAPQWAQKAAGFAGKAMMGPLGFMPTSEQITKPVEAVTGPMYEAKTVPGQYAQTAGQFAPAALLGPGKMGQKVAMGLGGALASETGGQLTKDTRAEPYARLGGALLGGAAGAKLGGAGVYKSAGALKKEYLKKAPSLEEVSTQADELYAAVKARDIQFPSKTFKPVVAKLRKSFEGLDSNVAPHANALKNSLIDVLPPMKVQPSTSVSEFTGHIVHNKPLPDRRTIPLNKIENVRKTAAAAARDYKLSDTERMGAGKVVSAIEDYYKSIPGLTDEMAPAREMARREILGKKIKKMTDKSEWYLGGEESGLKNQVSSFGKREGAGLTPAERKAFQSVVRKEGLNSLLSTGGGRLGQMMLGVGGLSSGGAPGLLLALGGHLGARKLSEKSTMKALERAMATVLLGKKGQMNIPKRGLLSGNVVRPAGLLGAASQAGD